MVNIVAKIRLKHFECRINGFFMSKKSRSCTRSRENEEYGLKAVVDYVRREVLERASEVSTDKRETVTRLPKN